MKKGRGGTGNQLLGRRVSLPAYPEGWAPEHYVKFFDGAPGVIEAVHVDHGYRGNPYFVLVRNHKGETMTICLGDLRLAPSAAEVEANREGGIIDALNP